MTISDFRIFSRQFFEWLPSLIDTVFDVDFLPFDLFIGFCLFGLCFYGVRKLLFE